MADVTNTTEEIAHTNVKIRREAIQAYNAVYQPHERGIGDAWKKERVIVFHVPEDLNPTMVAECSVIFGEMLQIFTGGKRSVCDPEIYSMSNAEEPPLKIGEP